MPSTPEVPEACATPTNPQVTILGKNRLAIEWAPVSQAKGYVIQARLRGSSSWVITAFLRSSIAKIWAIPNQDFEYRLKTICMDGSESAYSPVYEFSTVGSGDFNSSTAGSRTEFIADIDFNKPVEKWTVSPNPVVNTFQLTYQVKTDQANAVLYHVSGKKVADQGLTKGDSLHLFDMADLESGVYILQINDGSSNVISERIVKGSRY